MSKGKKLLIFAIVLVVLAGAFAAISALQDRGVIPGGESSVEEESSQWSSTAVNFFEDREAMDVASIEVKNKAVTYTLVSTIEKATDSSGTETTRQIWKMKEHEGWTLSDSSINNIVSIGTTLKRVAVMSESREGVDLANFGLANPLAEIRIDYTDGATVTVYVGDMTPDGIYRYAYLSDRDGVFTIYKSTATYAEYDLATLRSLTIPGIDVEEELTHLMLQKKGERKIELVRYEDDEVNEYVYDSSNMKMVSPYNWTTAVVTGNLNEMFSKMEGVSVKSLVDPDATDLAKYGLSEEDPEYHVFVETREAIKTKDADGNVVTTSYEYHPTDYYFGTVVEGDETMRYFRTGDSNDVYTVSAGSVSCFDFTPINYLSHLIFIYEISKLDSFAVTGVPAGETKTQTFTGSILRQNEEEADLNSYTSQPEPLEAYYFDGKLVDEDPFKDLYQAMIGIMFDYEIVGETPDYDKNDKIVFSYHKPTGETMTTEYYRLNNFYYVTRFGEECWMACNSDQMDHLWKTIKVLQEAE